MGLGDYMLERVGDATYTPGVNPAVKMYDPQSGTYHDAQGNAVPLYKQPNWFQRAVSPTADEFSAKNVEESAKSLQAQQDEAIQKQTFENRERPALESFFGNRYQPQADDINYGVNPTGAFDAGRIMDYGRQGLDYQNNILPSQSSQDVASTQNSSVLAQNRKLLNVPQQQAENEAANLGYNTELTQAEKPYIPYKVGNEGAQDINEMWRQQNIQPILNQLDAGTSNEQLHDLPSTVAGMRANSVGSLYQQEHPDIYSSPFNASVNPEEGTIKPGVFVSPEMRSAYGIMNDGGIPGMSGQPQSVMGPLGRPLNITPNAGSGSRQLVNPLQDSGMTNGSQNTNTVSSNLPPPNTQAIGAGDDSGQQQQHNNVQLGTSLGGEDESQNKTYPPMTKSQALAQMGLIIDKNGNIQKAGIRGLVNSNNGLIGNPQTFLPPGGQPVTGNTLTPQQIKIAQSIMSSNMPQ